MSSTLNNDSTSTTVENTSCPVHHVPTDTDGIPIKWDGNPAYLEGALYEASEFYKRTGLFEALIADGAVALSNGKLAVDSLQAISLVSGVVTSPITHDFFNPCPPTPERIIAFDAAATAASSPKYAAPSGGIPAEISSTFITARYTVIKEDRAFYASLSSIVHDADILSTFCIKSNSSGRTLIPIMLAYAASANATEKALVTTELTNFVYKGLTGEINIETFNNHLKEYYIIVRRKPSANRPTDEDTLEMLRNIMNKNPSTRELFELKCAVSARVTLEAMVTLIRTMLRVRKAAAQLDELTSTGGAQHNALTVQQVKDLQKIPETMRTPQANRDLSFAVQQQKALLAAADPSMIGGRSGGRGRDGDRGRGRPRGRGGGRGGDRNSDKPATGVVPPKDENGKIIRWIEGMGSCTCGGKHLYRDCPTGGKKPEQTAAVAEICPASDDGSDALASALQEQLQSFYSSNATTICFDSPPSIQQSLVASNHFDTSTTSGKLMADEHERGQYLGLVARLEPQTSVYKFDHDYTDFDQVGFFAINVGPQRGVYFTDWEHAAPYVNGFSAPPGVTTHERFKREADALNHCRKFSGLALADYVLIDDRPSLAVPLGLLVSDTPADGVDTPAPSTRVDATDPDGNAYTRAEFVAFYGGSAEWDASLPAPAPPVAAPPPPEYCEYPGCRRTVFIETDTGHAHPYCGITHALAHKAQLQEVTEALWPAGDEAAAAPLPTAPAPAARVAPSPPAEPAPPVAAPPPPDSGDADSDTPELVSDSGDADSDDSSSPSPPPAPPAPPARRKAKRKAAAPDSTPPQLHWVLHTLVGLAVGVILTLTLAFLFSSAYHSNHDISAPPSTPTMPALHLRAAVGTPDHVATPDHTALVAMGSPAAHVAALQPSAPSSRVASQALSFGKVLFWLAATLFFFWPHALTTIAAWAPIDVSRSIVMVSITPLLAAFPSLMKAVSLASFGALTARNGARSLNRLRPHLPWLVSITCLLSSLCFSASQSPSTPPPPDAIQLCPPSASAAVSLGNLTNSLDAPAYCGSDGVAAASTWLTTVDLPYHGMWIPPVASSATATALVNSHSALLSAQEAGIAKSRQTSLPIVCATPDSGATASLTPVCKRLRNVKPCNEIFGSAEGQMAQASCMGDMPVIARAEGGALVRFTFTNVRCVPSFKYTLLSVTQLWQEQSVDARFRDLNRLEMPDSSGGFSIPYDKSLRLSTLVLVSEAELSPCSTTSSKSAISSPSSASLGLAQRALVGFHSIKSTAHVARMPASQASEFMHRRTHKGVDAIRAYPDTTHDAPRNLTAAPKTACIHCAAAQIRKAPHSGHLHTPAAEPGVLHSDLKQMRHRSAGGALYVQYFIDEYTRYVWVEFLKDKSEVIAATMRVFANFTAKVGVPVDEHGVPRERPHVRTLHSDHEGQLESKAFKQLKADMLLHSDMSPPHDHNLNPIAERIIGVIDTLAVAFKEQGQIPDSLWPYIIRHAVDVHNASVSSIGSSSANAQISAYQRLTLRQPSVMDLAPPGVRAIVLKPPTAIRKGALEPRGWVGTFLGRSSHSINCWDVWCNGKIVSSSSVAVDEEFYPWRGKDAYQPLSPSTTAAAHPTQLPLGPSAITPPDVASSFAKPSSINLPAVAPPELVFFDMYSGRYDRPDGLAKRMLDFGWKTAHQFDNDKLLGGGWRHDVLNDATYSRLLEAAANGAWDAMMVAEDCATYTSARFFDASGGNGDPGPPPVRTKTHPDGLPEDQLDPRYATELRNANKRLRRTVDIMIAAHKSSKRTTIIFENPADYSIPGETQYAADLHDHGSIFGTSEFLRLKAAIQPSSTCTFAACKFGLDARKYTTLFFTNDAASVLSPLDKPDFKCDHPAGTHEKAGGRNADGSWASARYAAYTPALITRLAMAFTCARTGDPRPISQQGLPKPPIAPTLRIPGDSAPVHGPSPDPDGFSAEPGGVPFAPASAFPASPRPASASPSSVASPVPFAGFPTPSAAMGGGTGSTPSQQMPASFSSLSSSFSNRSITAQPQGFSTRSTRASTRSATLSSDQRASGTNWSPKPREQLPTVAESPSPQSSYIPFDPDERSLAAINSYFQHDTSVPLLDIDSELHLALAAARHTSTSTSAADVMENGAADVAYNHCASGIQALTEWSELDAATDAAALLAMGAIHASRDEWHIEASFTELQQFSSGDHHAALASLNQRVHLALRADSANAPSNHAEAERMGEPWPTAEATEMKNHLINGSWKIISKYDKPSGRRVHRFVWVYKLKRDGLAKARLCIQGCTLESGVDFDQTFSSTLRYCSARALFAFAARRNCYVRSIDFVAAYLQGEFVEGEVVYCSMPPGYEQYDADGNAYLCEIVKPIYGIPQAGRRLQRRVFPWMTKTMTMRQLDDSDACVFTYDDPTGKETLTVGVYVDNLQVVHSSAIDANGDAIDKSSFLHRFLTQLRSDWDIVDEGPMVDLLAIETRYNADGSITLHQETYVRKLLAKYMPDGVPSSLSRQSLPYTSDVIMKVLIACEASTAAEPAHPKLVRPFQERLGALLYLATSTRVDLAFVVPVLCRAMSRPSPDLMHEVDLILAYLARNPSTGLTYERRPSKLVGFADASWETKNSTSGWVIFWQGCAVSWGSRKQQCVALSSCEAEIIALSEASKDMVYMRKFVNGLNRSYEPNPSPLSTDNMGARALSYNPEFHDKTKHIERRHFFVRDMVEKFELTVPFVKTANNLADFFTKALHPKQFFAMRKLIMNEPGE